MTAFRWTSNARNGGASESRLYYFRSLCHFLTSPSLANDQKNEKKRQGSRTPHTDPLARGALVGLTLSHTRAHVHRAILESVCYGTRSCFDALESAARRGQSPAGGDVDASKGGRDDGREEEGGSSEVVIAGGAARSDLWLQLHADVTGRTFLLNENSDGPLLGCAILASVGAGVHDSVESAVESMVRRERRVEPRPDVRGVYDRLYEEVYLKVRPGVTPVFHALANIRGGGMSNRDDDNLKETKKSPMLPNKHGKLLGLSFLRHLRGGSAAGEDGSPLRSDETTPRAPVIISPSLLAADWYDLSPSQLFACTCIISENSHHFVPFDS